MKKLRIGSYSRDPNNYSSGTKVDLAQEANFGFVLPSVPCPVLERVVGPMAEYTVTCITFYYRTESLRLVV